MDWYANSSYVDEQEIHRRHVAKLPLMKDLEVGYCIRTTDHPFTWHDDARYIDEWEVHGRHVGWLKITKDLRRVKFYWIRTLEREIDMNPQLYPARSWRRQFLATLKEEVGEGG